MTKIETYGSLLLAMISCFNLGGYVALSRCGQTIEPHRWMLTSFFGIIFLFFFLVDWAELKNRNLFKIKNNLFKIKNINENSSLIERELEVIRLSHLIQFLINVKPTNCKVVFPIGKYQLTSQSRLFSDGWHDLWEISVPGQEWHQSWSNNNGTRTINLPPDNVVNEVISTIKDMI